jgi:hypothetical protein
VLAGLFSGTWWSREILGETCLRVSNLALSRDKMSPGLISSTDVHKVISQLGRTLHTSAYAANNAGVELDTTEKSQTSNQAGPGHDLRKTPTKPGRVDKGRLASLVHELQDTESKYLKRIKCLKNVGIWSPGLSKEDYIADTVKVARQSLMPIPYGYSPRGLRR